MSKKNAYKNTEEDIMSGHEREVQTDTAKCPGCGADMLFFPERQVLRCEHCNTEKQFEVGKSAEKNINDLFEETNRWTDETHAFCCNNCGSKQILPKNEIAVHCSFCGTSNIVEINEFSGLKPNAVVPFKITKENAVSKIIKWVKSKFFAPKKFVKDINVAAINGVYNPAFTFDANTISFYRGRLGRYKYTTKHINGKTVTERTTEYFHIGGSFNMLFDDILIQASTVIGQKNINKLQPFSTNESCTYTKEFLHGYSANQYTKDGKQCWTEARTQIDKSIRKGILNKYTYDVVDSLNISTNYNALTYKYMLLPLYIGHFDWKNKAYNFFINGYNGKIVGKTPVSGVKVLVLTGIILVAIAAAFLLIRLLGG